MIAKLRRPLLLLGVLAIVLPVLLIVSALRTFAALEEQKGTYLRSRAAAMAARLETLEGNPGWREALADSEPGLLDVEVLDKASSPAFLAPLWAGEELFRTEMAARKGAPFRAYVPFHSPSGGGMKVARIDLDAGSADFLVEHATHHLWIVGAGAVAILALSLLTLRSVRAAARAEQKRLEMQHLAQLGEMSAVLAHEIRNPLGTIKGFAQLLGESPGADAALVAPILNETDRLERLVKDLLAYGRPAQPSFRPVDTREVEQTMRQHAARFPGRLDFSVEAATFDTDPALLEQALLNLLQNALEATEAAAGEAPAGKVRFEARANGGGITFRVADNGPGLSEDARRHLFQAFHTSKASGTGLGLGITRRLVELLGGRLEIANRPEGGVAAEIHLPKSRKG